MADFKPILKTILAVEGGWVDDEDDSGGETWQGVARNITPSWKGWPIIDAYKKMNPKTTLQARNGRPQVLNKILYADAQLAQLVSDFYERSYWSVNRLGEIVDQQLARNVADCGVNCGTGTASRMLQRAVNEVLDFHRSEIPELKVDGKIGSTTINVVNSVKAYLIYDQFNSLRKAYYDAIIARNPSQAKYRRSWYSRIIPYVS